MKTYDLIVIGSGPAGEKAAVKAAYFRKKVALIEKHPHYGGAGVHTGTIPSKTLRETALYFSGKYEKGLFGIERKLEHEATIQDFMYRKNRVVKSQNQEVKKNILMHNIDIYNGTGVFEDSHHIKISGESENLIYGENILIATGSFPLHPSSIPFDGKRIHDSDSILDIDRIPESICIAGAGVIGCEYATIFCTMGTKVVLVNPSSEVLPFIDNEIADELIKSMANAGVSILDRSYVSRISVPQDNAAPLKIDFSDDSTIECDMFLYTAGRSAATQSLRCENTGLIPDLRGRIEVNKNYQTAVPHIYAAGDVVGFPALASTSMNQGRTAVSHIFGLHDLPETENELPYGIYTIPEISMIGITEQEALKKGIDYLTGKAKYSDMPRGKIIGSEEGFLKIIFRKDDLTVLGVHIIGSIASEIIHYGMTLVQSKVPLTNIISAVFNYPTLHDLYKYAAYDGLGNRAGYKVKN